MVSPLVVPTTGIYGGPGGTSLVLDAQEHQLEAGHPKGELDGGVPRHFARFLQCPRELECALLWRPSVSP